MNDNELKTIINNGAINTLIDDDFEEYRVENILEDYIEIIDEINKDYNEKTKKLVSNENKPIYFKEK